MHHLLVCNVFKGRDLKNLFSVCNKDSSERSSEFTGQTGNMNLRMNVKKLAVSRLTLHEACKCSIHNVHFVSSACVG